MSDVFISPHGSRDPTTDELRQLIARGQHEVWFTNDVAPEDRFVEPKLDISQYFFTLKTTDWIADLMSGYLSQCCISAPRVADNLYRRGRDVRLLDIDERFAYIPGFMKFDLLAPEPIGAHYDAYLVDPPFFDAPRLRAILEVADAKVSMSDIFLGYPRADRAALERAFRDFSLTECPNKLSYCNVRPSYWSALALYHLRPRLSCGSDGS